MKKVKFVVVLFVMFATISAMGQPKLEKQAKKIADEMTSVLSLSQEESTAIYEIQLERFKESQSIEDEFAADEEGKKEKLKALGNKVYNQTVKLLGKDRVKKWKDYKEKK